MLMGGKEECLCASEDRMALAGRIVADNIITVLRGSVCWWRLGSGPSVVENA